MTELRLVQPESDVGPFSAGTPLPRRLPRGRHGIPAGIVVEHQRLRLLTAMAEALDEHGYANVTTTHVSELANVSTSTFYKHFGNLWDCLLAAYVAAADRLFAVIEARCSEARPGADPLLAGIEAGLELFAAEPQLGLLLSAQAPRESTAINAARRLLISRLAAMLRRAGERKEQAQERQPASLDERLIDASLSFLHTQIARGAAKELPAHAPELAAILGRSRAAA